MPGESAKAADSGATVSPSDRPHDGAVLPHRCRQPMWLLGRCQKRVGGIRRTLGLGGGTVRARSGRHNERYRLPDGERRLLAYGVFIERWWGQFKSRSAPSEIMIRATLIFRREDGTWKAVHRHATTPWLRRRQANTIRRYSPNLVERRILRSSAIKLPHVASSLMVSRCGLGRFPTPHASKMARQGEGSVAIRHNSLRTFYPRIPPRGRYRGHLYPRIASPQLLEVPGRRNGERAGPRRERSYTRPEDYISICEGP